MQTAVATRRHVISPGGTLRTEVKQLVEAFSRTKLNPDILQLWLPLCSFNAFEFAYPDIFLLTTPFLLLGHGPRKEHGEA